MCERVLAGPTEGWLILWVGIPGVREGGAPSTKPVIGTAGFTREGLLDVHVYKARGALIARRGPVKTLKIRGFLFDTPVPRPRLLRENQGGWRQRRRPPENNVRALRGEPPTPPRDVLEVDRMIGFGPNPANDDMRTYIAFVAR